MKKRAKLRKRKRNQEEFEKSLKERKKKRVLDSLKPKYTKEMNDQRLKMMNAEPVSINPLDWFRKATRRKKKNQEENGEAEKKEAST